MRILPVVERELRVASRNSRFYWSRFTAALIAVAIVAWIWFTFGAGGSSAERSMQIFLTLASFSFAYCLLIGVMTTADSISEEKREGTLGLLFLTNLKGVDIVLGKLFANSLYSIYSVLAVLPVLAIPLLLGGLTPGDFWRVALVLLISLYLSLGVGMFVSTISRNDRKAQVSAFLILVFLTLILPMIVAWINYGLRHHHGFDFLGWASPLFTFVHAFEKQYQLNPGEFWISVLILLCLATLLVVLASGIAPLIWRDRPSSPKSIRRRVLSAPGFGGLEGQLKYRTALLDQNPFYWLAARDRLKPFYVFLFLSVAAILWMFLSWRLGEDMLDQAMFMLWAILLHTVIKVWLASEAGRRFFDDRRSGALELALSTPLDVKSILEGQFMALLRQFGWAVALILLFDLAAMIFGIRYSSGSRSEWVLLCVAGMLVLVADCVAIAALGMWLGLNSRRLTRAFLQSLFLILILPWIALFGFLMFASVFRMGFSSAGPFIGSYFIFSMLADLICFIFAMNKLNTNFREVAASPRSRS